MFPIKFENWTATPTPPPPPPLAAAAALREEWVREGRSLVSGVTLPATTNINNPDTHHFNADARTPFLAVGQERVKADGGGGDTDGQDIKHKVVTTSCISTTIIAVLTS